MKILLVTVDVRYIHSSPGIYSLEAYTRQQLEAGPPRAQNPVTIELVKYTINH